MYLPYMLISRRQTGRPIHKPQRSHPSTPHTQINGTQTTSNTNTNQQHNGTRHIQNKCNEKTKINVHIIPLVTMPKESRTFVPFLGARHKQ